ncbi:MAG TPA: cyclodeaminase/cyclohydrolase family protein [Streptosporangiaceae bacterium]|nr:cyclodeaminase/cyclohydrolase family protein [Streptosporangiaceae bacterium]
MRNQQIGSWLDDLASSAPAPGGGSAAALLAAAGAALVEKVCNLTIGKPRFAGKSQPGETNLLMPAKQDYEGLMRSAVILAAGLRGRAVELSEADSAAFGAVSRARELPRDTEAGKIARAGAIQAALIGAAEVPIRTAQVAAEVIHLAYRIQAGADVSVLSDVAVAAASARAALDSAVVSVEINLAAIQDETRHLLLRTELDRHVGAAAMADSTIAAVRYRINGRTAG